MKNNKGFVATGGLVAIVFILLVSSVAIFYFYKQSVQAPSNIVESVKLTEHVDVVGLVPDDIIGPIRSIQSLTQTTPTTDLQKKIVAISLPDLTVEKVVFKEYIGGGGPQDVILVQLADNFMSKEFGGRVPGFLEGEFGSEFNVEQIKVGQQIITKYVSKNRRGGIGLQGVYFWEYKNINFIVIDFAESGKSIVFNVVSKYDKTAVLPVAPATTSNQSNNPQPEIDQEYLLKEKEVKILQYLTDLRISAEVYYDKGSSYHDFCTKDLKSVSALKQLAELVGEGNYFCGDNGGSEYLVYARSFTKDGYECIDYRNPPIVVQSPSKETTSCGMK